MSIRPLHDRIVVKQLEAAGVTSGGIIIPENAKEKPLQAMVIAVGNGARNKDGDLRPLDVKAGDRVLFQRYGGTEVTINGESCTILREDDILAVID